MSETGNIETMAKLVFDELFKYFKWSSSGPRDIDWECVTDIHGKKTHPSDVVFYYDDPYSGMTVYQNVDLKSYAKSSIQVTSITKALKSLAIATECANISEDWQKLYLIKPDGFDQVSGILFIYNHDGDFDKNFQDHINTIDFEKIPISEFGSLTLMGPDLIEKLLNIVCDLKMLKGDDLLPSIENYTFFYPDLVRSRRNGDEWKKAATIEALTAPWLIIKHRGVEDKISDGFIIYYHPSGETIEEFIYLIDAMSHYQMLVSDYKIRVRLVNPSNFAISNFEKAKIEYMRIWGEDEARRKQMSRVECAQIKQFTTRFSEIEIGMQYE